MFTLLYFLGWLALGLLVKDKVTLNLAQSAGVVLIMFVGYITGLALCDR